VENEYERVRALLPKLSKPQFKLLSRVYAGDDRFANRKTADKLVSLGLIEAYNEREQRSGICVLIRRYRMPSLGAHMAWCSYCEETAPDAEVEA